MTMENEFPEETLTERLIELEKEELSSLPQEIEEEIPEATPSPKQEIEALLFSVNEPLSIAKLKNVLAETQPADTESIKAALAELKEDYLARDSAFELTEIAGGYILQTREAYTPILEAYYQKQTPQRLSRAAYEVLAIIAYRQPITRAEIDVIRGVDSTGPVSHLIEKNLVKMTGRKEVPGHPPLYGTTKEFLELCGLGSLSELPELKELKKPKKRQKAAAKKTEKPKTPAKPQEINLTLPL